MDEILELEFDNKFDVEWTNRDDTYASVIGQMYANAEQFDLIIKLDGNQQLPAHRHVMAIVSPEIKGMLEEELNPNQSFVTEVSEGKLFVRLHMKWIKIRKNERKCLKLWKLCFAFWFHA